MQENEITAEMQLAQVWQEALHVDKIGLDDDFFSLGGDSLLAIKVIAMAVERGLPVTLLALFKTPTVRGVCAELSP